MRISKKITAIFLAVLMIVSAVPFTASAVMFRTDDSTIYNPVIDVASLNVGDYITGNHTFKFSDRIVVAEAGPYSMYINGQNVSETTSVTLDSSCYVQNGVLKDDVNNLSAFFQGFYVASIDNGVVTFGTSVPGSGGGANPVQNAPKGLAGNPYTQDEMDNGVPSGGSLGGPGFGPAINPSFGFGDEEENETPDVEAYRTDANGNKWYYTYLEDAVADSIEGETITLYKDVDLTDSEYGRNTAAHIFNLRNRTLDLNEKTITLHNMAVGFSGDNMTIKNGTYKCVRTDAKPATSYALPIYPEKFSRQSGEPSELNVVSDKSENVILEDLTLNPGGLNVKGADVTLKDCNVTGTYYHGLWAEFDSIVTVESGNYTTTNPASTSCVFNTQKKTTGNPKIDDYSKFIVKGGTFTKDSSESVSMLNTSVNASQYSIKGGTFVNANGSACDVRSRLAANCSQNMETGVVTQSAANDGANITVAETISQNFYIDADFYGEEKYATITYNHASNASETPNFQTETIQLKDLPALDDPTSAYTGARMLSVLQAPAQSTEKITIKVYEDAEAAQSATGAVHEVEYSVYDYCKTIIDNEQGTYTEDLQNLAKSTLDYAAAAQTYFNYNTDNMATQLNEDNAFYGEVESTDLTSVAGISSLPSCFNNYAVVVKSDLEIKLFTTTSISVTDATLSTTNGGERFSATTGENGDYYYVHIKGIEPANMDNQITVVTSEGDIVLTANSILKMMSKSTNANLATLGKAMYLYGAAANELFG